jgi:hypothetical protein
MVIQNPNCDGCVCKTETGEVRVYPIGGGSNLILCQACWAHENRYNYERGQEVRDHTNFPQRNWFASEVYTAG